MKPTQNRADATAYRRYLAGMDATMRQKVALTAAHLLGTGRVADMGMGSGAGSDALAALYPMLEVVGVDLDRALVDRARDVYARPNLTFVVGDIAAPDFDDASLDGILDSSVLHHVTSFGGYRHDAAADALAAQVRTLREHGVIVVRDFLHPGVGEVLLDLPADDGDDTDDPRSCSTASLFERFAREFRSLHGGPGFPFRRLDPERAEATARGHRRYRCSLVHAVEFVLRKDYRVDWEAEVREEYTYFTQDQFEALFHALGLRALASAPLRNPWIVRNRFRGKFVLRDLDGKPHEDPATNYIIVGERVGAGEGVRFEDRGDAPLLGYLEMSHWRDIRDESIRDLVRRPHRTIDVIPWFELDGTVFVLARTSYPRPIAGAIGLACSSPSLDGTRSPAWMAEPFNVLQTDKPLGQTVEEALASAVRMSADRILSMRPGTTYYPSAGGTQEEVTSVFVEIEPLFLEEQLPRSTAFSSAGRMRAIEAQQVLRSAQVGGLPDARLEINVYDLLSRLGHDLGPWIGESLVLAEGPAPPLVGSLSTMTARPARRCFRRVDRREGAPFLSVRCRLFAELDAAGQTLATDALELVVPTARGTNTIVTALLLQCDGVVYVGIDDDDLPAAQCFTGTSELLVTPAWRLPAEVATRSHAQRWIAERVRDEYGVVTGECYELGGRFLPSAGLSPEVAVPLAYDVVRLEPSKRSLHWIRLEEMHRHASLLADGHLRVVSLRASHALPSRGRRA